MKAAALNINFDSISDCLKLVGEESGNFDDPAFFGAADRFMDIADRLNVKYTIFVIGKDLLNKKHFDRVRSWARNGHEIGNHTYSHYQNFAHLKLELMYGEIKRAHDIISDCAGYEPRGFISPAWSYSPHQLEILEQLNYSYDTSLLPSYLMPLIQLKLRIKSMRGSADIPVIRKDLRGSLYGSRQPFFATRKNPWRAGRQYKGKVIMLPLPMAGWRFPVWHSMSFLFPEKTYEGMLESAVRRSDAFYYLMHPADLVCPDKDIKHLPSALSGIERMCVPLARKQVCLENAISVIGRSCSFVTMSELAEIQRKKYATG